MDDKDREVYVRMRDAAAWIAVAATALYVAFLVLTAMGGGS